MRTITIVFKFNCNSETKKLTTEQLHILFPGLYMFLKPNIKEYKFQHYRVNANISLSNNQSFQKAHKAYAT